MVSVLPQDAATGLERPCVVDGGAPAARGDWVRVAPGCKGIERVEANFEGRAFAPHRHDTYAIGLTTRGV